MQEGVSLTGCSKSCDVVGFRDSSRAASSQKEVGTKEHSVPKVLMKNAPDFADMSGSCIGPINFPQPSFLPLKKEGAARTSPIYRSSRPLVRGWMARAPPFAGCFSWMGAGRARLRVGGGIGGVCASGPPLPTQRHWISGRWICVWGAPDLCPKSLRKPLEQRFWSLWTENRGAPKTQIQRPRILQSPPYRSHSGPSGPNSRKNRKKDPGASRPRGQKRLKKAEKVEKRLFLSRFQTFFDFLKPFLTGPGNLFRLFREFGPEGPE